MTKFARLLTFALLTTSLWSLSPTRGSGDAGPAFVVVCHASNPLTSMTSTDLRKAFTGGVKQWGSGAVIQVGIIPGDNPETAYLAKLLDTTPTELMRRMQEQVFRGEMRRPVILHSSADCIALARSNGGALCIASSAAAAGSGVRVVAMH